MAVDYIRRLSGKENLDAGVNLTYREDALLNVGEDLPILQATKALRENGGIALLCF
jgi:hypothetical protein